ncbi:hypothetical protein VST63_11210 [Mycolicibacterium sp. 050232]|uniref:hypothetical protein n=1 Tax=Mycolicibacterium sp. 050232 TaxID=3113982 RepID=UPI002E2B91B9|nr:hypothetical protein [Mycolicibacterium sp. 050232]MED5812929.1 hypothetical protein [Mycolicibacterium sp. 050232]
MGKRGGGPERRDVRGDVGMVAPPTDQTAQRWRRQRWLHNVYTGSFDLVAEVTELLGDLARQVTELADPVVVRPRVEECMSAVVGCVEVVAASPPVLPRLPDDALRDGSWVPLLVMTAQRHSPVLRALLDRAHRPGQTFAAQGSPSALLEVALRELDGAAYRLGRVVGQAQRRQAVGSVGEFNANLAAEADRRRERARRSGAAARLAKYGVAIGDVDEMSTG